MYAGRLWVTHGRWLPDIEPVRRSERAPASLVLLNSSDAGSSEKSTAANQAAGSVIMNCECVTACVCVCVFLLYVWVCLCVFCPQLISTKQVYWVMWINLLNTTLSSSYPEQGWSKEIYSTFDLVNLFRWLNYSGSWEKLLLDFFFFLCYC